MGMEGNRHLSRVRGSALPIAYAAVVLCLVELLGGFVVPGAFARYGGLAERAFLASVLLWMGWVSVAMLRGRGPDGAGASDGRGSSAGEPAL